MKLLAWLTCISASGAALAGELPAVQSQVYEAPGQTAEIATRARLCAVKLLRNDEFQLNDSTTSSGLGLSGGVKTPTSASGGDVISMADIEGGSIVVKYRFPFKFALVSQVGEATTTILTKDGRFKMESDGFRSAQLSTGYSANNGFQTVDEKSFVVKPFIKALNEQQAKLIACIASPTNSDW